MYCHSVVTTSSPYRLGLNSNWQPIVERYLPHYRSTGLYSWPWYVFILPVTVSMTGMKIWLLKWIALQKSISAVVATVSMNSSELFSIMYGVSNSMSVSINMLFLMPGRIFILWNSILPQRHFCSCKQSEVIWTSFQDKCSGLVYIFSLCYLYLSIPQYL